MKENKTLAPVTTNGMTYQPTPMNLGFIILCFDNDPHKPATTLSTIKNWYGNVKTIVVAPEEFKNVHKTAKVGGGSITSLINTGMKNAPNEWNVMLFSGVRIKEKLDQRYSAFMENRRDIFFPLLWGKHSFLEAPLNGLTIHRDTFKEIGKFADNNPLDICKMIWFLEATKIGCKFKAIAGTRMC